MPPPRNSIAASFTKYTIPSLVKEISANHAKVSGFFRHSSPIFGPYYDSQRPMHQLKTVEGKQPYAVDVSMDTKSIAHAFRSKGPPFYSLSIDPDALGLASFNITEMVSLGANHSSVNLWLGMAKGTTPCHFDGYHNMCVGCMPLILCCH